MSANKHIYTVLLLIVAFSTQAYAKLDRAEIRHQFLILSAGDIRYYEFHEKAKKKLYRSGSDAIAVSLEYMGRKSPRKANAIKQIAEGVGEDAVEPLTYILTRPDEDNAAFAAYLLGKIGSKSGAVPLMLAAKSSSEDVRSAAVGALGSCKDTSAVPILIEALSDSLSSVRRKAAYSLGQLEDERGIYPLIELLSDSCADVRYAASNAIAAVGGKDATIKLLEKLEDNSLDEFERYHIIQTLGLLGSNDALPILFELLEDTHYLNRGFSCQALGYFRGDFEVANALKRSLHDASGFVQMMAREALDSMRNEQ